jgi:hypothetical protein
LLSWDVEQVERAMAQSVGRIEEDRANVAMCRALLDLLAETGESIVQAALAATRPPPARRRRSARPRRVR